MHYRSLYRTLNQFIATRIGKEVPLFIGTHENMFYQASGAGYGKKYYH
jgi:hypothetical protein